MGTVYKNTGCRKRLWIAARNKVIIDVDTLISAVEPPPVTNTLLTNSEQVKKDVPGNA